MITKSKSQTQKLAAKLAKKIINAKRLTLNARVIALQGELGAGKTAFVQGFLKALGITQHATSPTFVIFRKYKIAPKRSNALPAGRQITAERFFVYHFDLYRIHGPKEILDLGFKKIIKDPHNIVLIEWPEKVKKILPKNMIWIKFEHGKNEKERIIKVIKNL